MTYYQPETESYTSHAPKTHPCITISEHTHTASYYSKGSVHMQLSLGVMEVKGRFIQIKKLHLTKYIYVCEQFWFDWIVMYPPLRFLQIQ